MASIPAQGTVWSIAPQAGRLGDANIDVSTHSWYRYRVARVTGGPMQDQQTLPLELSGVLVPTGGFKSGAYWAQEVDLIPRLEDSIGWLLLAVTGSVSSVAGQKYGPSGWTTFTGADGHVFRFNPTDHTDMKWLATRMRVPGVNSGSVHGEVAQDCRASGLRLNVPGAGLITGTFGVQGRKYSFPDATAVNAWTYANQFESSASIAHAGTGSLSVGSTIPKITGLTLSLIHI